MEGKILGIPLVLILLVLTIVVLVDFPLLFSNAATQQRLTNVEYKQFDTQAAIQRLFITPTVEPTATPSATPVTLKNVSKQPVVTPATRVR